jgi:cytochrome c oxidase cbb3-type subunit 1
MYSVPAIELHFWIATLGVVLYIAVDVDRRRDAGPDVARRQPRRQPDLHLRRSVKATYPFYVIRLLGGVLYLSGMLRDGLEHVWKTIATARSRAATHRMVPPAAAHA